ncbi:MAG: NADAR family protein [Planctomycetaceae bacterium]
MTQLDVINFYLRNEEYGYFSNFSAHRIFINGKSWPTVEHYFQAQKFAGQPEEEKIRLARSAREAANMGRNRKIPLRKDWESIKINIMRDAVYAKFTQHDELKDLLLVTENAKLVEHTANDHFWGDGGDGSGEHWLGRILMEVREKISRDSQN